MTLYNWIQLFTTLTFPIVCGFAFFLFNWLSQKLPLQQRLALEQFAKQAVLSIEQQLEDLENPEKRKMAINLIEDCFKHFGLPVPPDFLIEMAIESAIKEMKIISNQKIN